MSSPTTGTAVKWPFFAAVLTWTITSIASAIDDYPRGPVPCAGQTFRASFDNGPQADAGAGYPAMHARTRSTMAPEGWQFDFVSGRFRRGLDVRGGRTSKADANQQVPNEGEEASFKAQGNFCLRVGTLSFWCRTAASVPGVKITSQSNDNAVHPLVSWKDSGIEVVDRTYADHTCRFSGVKLDDDRWHHVAIAWDEGRGVRGYVDGEICGQRWGQNAYQSGYLSTGRLALRGAVFDEVRIFDIALTDEQIQAVAGGKHELPGRAAAISEVTNVHRLEHLGWHTWPEGERPNQNRDFANRIFMCSIDSSGYVPGFRFRVSRKHAKA